MKFILAITAAAVAGLSLSPAAFAETYFNGRSIYGANAAPAAARATVDVSKAKYINIKCGDTITFVSGEKTFSWKFDVSNHRDVALAKIAPAGFNAGNLKVYVDSNDMELGG